MEKHSTINTKPSTFSGLTEADREYFHQVTTQAYESWNRGERRPYIDRYSSNAIFMAPHEETIVGKEAIQDFVMAYPDVRVEFPAVEIFGTSRLAIVRGTFVINDPEGNFLDKGKYLSVWQKSSEGQWNITHDIFNSDLPVRNVQEKQ